MSADSVGEPAFKALLKRVEELEKRIDELESGADGSTTASSGGFSAGPDPRDKAVLDQIDRGEEVTAARLKQLYQTYTDIRTKRTLKSRVKSITNRTEFEWIAPGKWRYMGGDSDE